MSVALVPVKRLGETKSRLFARSGSFQGHARGASGGARGGLERSAGEEHARGALVLAMLEDVIAALRSASANLRVVVVTPDADVARAARDAGAEALVRDDPGLNEALENGAHAAALAPGEPLLVVLGDVAGALPGEIDALFDALASLGGRGVVLAPSSDGGSSALLRAPADAIPACFGPDSAKRHRDAAAARGVPFRELPLASLALDLDVPEDVEQFLRSRTGGAATRRVLRGERA